MVRAIFVRSLQPGVTVEQFVEAWRPEQKTDARVRTTVSVNSSNDRQVVTLLEFDGAAEDFATIAPTLAHPHALARLEPLVESTDVAAVFVEVVGPDAF
jgi:hypothetical protein